jgi:hypothetical protein
MTEARRGTPWEAIVPVAVAEMIGRMRPAGRAQGIVE